MNSDENYYLSILGTGNRCSNQVRELIEKKQYDEFTNWFVEGIEHQIGRKLSETSAVRIRSDLNVLIKQLTKE